MLCRWGNKIPLLPCLLPWSTKHVENRPTSKNWFAKIIFIFLILPSARCYFLWGVLIYCFIRNTIGTPDLTLGSQETSVKCIRIFCLSSNTWKNSSNLGKSSWRLFGWSNWESQKLLIKEVIKRFHWTPIIFPTCLVLSFSFVVSVNNESRADIGEILFGFTLPSIPTKLYREKPIIDIWILFVCQTHLLRDGLLQ